MSPARTFFKRAEIAFRRFLLQSLSLFGKTTRPLPEDFDFSTVKILLARQDKIGDVLVLTPIISTIKHRYPACTIDVLLSEKNHFVLANNPLVRQRWVYRKRIGNALRLLRAIRKERYDILVDPIDNPSATSTLLSLLCGARWAVGLSKENAFAYNITVPLLSRKDTHIVDRLAELLRVFRIDPTAEQLRIEYSVSADSLRFADQAFQELGLEGNHVIGVNISAGDDTRFWGIQNFRELLHKISEAFPDYYALILFKPSDRKRAEVIAEGIRNVVVAPLADSFDRFAALVRKVNTLITPDTSAVHLAAAFHIPSVVLYVQSNKELGVWYPYKTPAEALIADVDNLAVISPLEVFQAWVRLCTTYLGVRMSHPTS